MVPIAARGRGYPVPIFRRPAPRRAVCRPGLLHYRVSQARLRPRRSGNFHIPAPRHRDLNRQSHHPVRSQAPVRERQRQVRRRQPLRADRGQRVRQVDVHEDHRRRPGTLGGQRVAGAGRAPGQAAPGPVRVRGLPGAGRGHDGPHRNVVGHVRARRDLRQPRGQRRRLHARRRPGGQVRRIRRLHRRGARRRAAAGPGNRRRPAQPADARSGAGLEAARAAGAGAVLESRRAAAGRADQQPGHQHDPLAGERAQRLPEHDDHHQPRSSLPEPGVHAHGRRGLWRDPHLPRQLRRLHAGLDPGSRAPGVQQRQGQGTRRRAAGLRAPLRRQQVQVAPGHVAPEADRPHQGRAGRGQALVAPEPVHPLRAEQGHAPPGGQRRAPDQVLRRAGHQEFSAMVEAGEKIAIIGANGVGKTTCCACWPRTWRRIPAR